MAAANELVDKEKYEVTVAGENDHLTLTTKAKVGEKGKAKITFTVSPKEASDGDPAQTVTLDTLDIAEEVE